MLQDIWLHFGKMRGCFYTKSDIHDIWSSCQVITGSPTCKYTEQEITSSHGDTLTQDGETEFQGNKQEQNDDLNVPPTVY